MTMLDRLSNRATKKGEAAYHELAKFGLFEGRSRDICLVMMEDINPHKPGTRKHRQWENGWLKGAGIERGSQDVPA